MPGGYVIEFPETTPANTDIGTVVATDSDGGVNGQVCLVMEGLIDKYV